jgi:WhiB family redox-sensing transcriptional regulator
MGAADTQVLATRTVPAVPWFHWHPGKKCADVDPEVMHPETARDEPAAVAVCEGCPFTTDCAAWALATGQVYGTFGGVTARERRKVLRLRYTTEQSST